MANKERIEEGINKGAFESPVGNNISIAGTKVRLNEKEFEITVGEDAVKSLKQLGISVKTDGTMSIPAHSTTKARTKSDEQEIGD